MIDKRPALIVRAAGVANVIQAVGSTRESGVVLCGARGAAELGKGQTKMEDFKGSHTGGCMCGAIRYEVSGKPLWVGYCHCRSCRRHSGAPVVTFAAFSASQVVFTKGERRVYNSSPGVGRAFCGACGTPLTWEGQSKLPERGHVVEFHISTLDEPEAFVPTNHVFYPQKLSWFDVADNLPRYNGLDYNSEISRHGPANGGLPK